MDTITETELHCLLWGIAIGLLMAASVVMWRTIKSEAKDLQERARHQSARNKSLLKRMRENPPTESAGVKTEISLDRRAIVEIVDRRTAEQRLARSDGYPVTSAQDFAAHTAGEHNA